ncbi:unnamed protein product [Ixodes pacificus]
MCNRFYRHPSRMNQRGYFDQYGLLLSTPQNLQNRMSYMCSKEVPRDLLCITQKQSIPMPPRAYSQAGNFILKKYCIHLVTDVAVIDPHERMFQHPLYSLHTVSETKLLVYTQVDCSGQDSSYRRILGRQRNKEVGEIK